MRYSGSPLKYSVSEARQKKSAVLVTLGEKGNVEVELCPLTPKRDLRQITGPLDRLVSPGVVSQGNPQDYLHVVLTDLAPVDPMGRLVAVYPNVVRLELCQQGMEPEELDTPVERQDPAELFARFYAQQTGEELDETALALVTGLLREEE
jgi:exonuclease SbcD